MKIWARLAVAFAVAAVVPTIALGLLAQRAVEEQARDAYEGKLALRVGQSRQQIERHDARTRVAVDQLCASDPIVDRVIVELAGRAFGPSQEERLASHLPGLMAARGFDALTLVEASGGTRGRVLGAGHYPDRAGARAPELLAAVASAGTRPFVRSVRAQRDGTPADRAMLLFGCIIDRDGVRLAVVAGHALDAELRETLEETDGPIRVRLVDAERGDVGTEASSVRQEAIHVFRDASGAPAARLIATIDDTELRDRIARLQQRTLWMAGGALLLALLVAALLAAAMSRPFRELEVAATRVGLGDLESTLDERRPGEVGRTLRAFNRMTEQLRETQVRLRRAERIAAWRDIARKIAHEVKNPLSPIQVSVETMRRTWTKKHPDFDEIFDESTRTILEEVRRLRDLVTEFSNFARMPRPKPKQFPLHEVIDHVVSLHRQDEVAIDASLPDDLPPIRADREQLVQVFVNLVQNAVDAASGRHGARGGRVRIRARSVDVEALDHSVPGVEIVVEDNGPGVPLDDRLRIFEPYVTGKPDGNGLGLAIVLRIIEDHDGRIEITDNPEGGATFLVRLRQDGPPRGLASATDTIVPLVRRRD